MIVGPNIPDHEVDPFWKDVSRDTEGSAEIPCTANTRPCSSKVFAELEDFSKTQNDGLGGFLALKAMHKHLSPKTDDSISLQRVTAVFSKPKQPPER